MVKDIAPNKEYALTNNIRFYYGAECPKCKTNVKNIVGKNNLCICYQCKKNNNSKYRDNNRIKIRESDKRFRDNNKEKIAKKKKIEYSKNRSKYIDRSREYYKNNKSHINEYYKKRREKDPIFRLKGNIRILICRSFSNNKMSKSNKTEDILGCSIEDFIKHIEKQFTKGMSWGNRSEWHIDHVVPLAEANTEEQIMELNHFTNLRPLWTKDNLSKGCKTEYLI